MLRIPVLLLLLTEYSCFLVLPNSNETVVLPPINGTVNPVFSRRSVNSGKIPIYYDWREENMLSPVKNQLNCAACWAFSTIAGIESHLKIYRNVEEVLSEQFLIDCDEAKKGCGNASILQTYAHIVVTFGGVLRDSDYYAYDEERRRCRWKPGTLTHNVAESLFRYPQPVPVIGFQRVFPDEDEMARYVYEHGPLSAAINSASMDRYEGGIDEPTDLDCSPNELDHAVLIVGYNVYGLYLSMLLVSKSRQQLPYWIIKNSWGTEWGDKGFYYLVRGRNACGIASDVSFPYVT